MDLEQLIDPGWRRQSPVTALFSAMPGKPNASGDDLLDSLQSVTRVDNRAGYELTIEELALSEATLRTKLDGGNPEAVRGTVVRQPPFFG